MPRTEGRSDRESIKVTLMGDTDLAWKVATVGKTAEVWVPKSQCDITPRGAVRGDECWLMIPQWLLDQKPELS